MKTIIHTIRHAETDFGVEKRYAGKIDVPLNDIGIRDTVKAAKLINNLPIDIVISSRLKRSIETAQIILNGRTIPLVQNELCNERSFGVMEGLTWDDVQTLDPPVLFIEVGDDLHSVNPIGSEPFEDVWARAQKLRTSIIEEFGGSKILIVSHGVFLQLFHGLFRGLSCIESLAHPYPANLELNSFQFSGYSLVEDKTIRLINDEEVKW